MNPWRKHTGTCRSCNAEIIWAQSPNDKALPLDARSVDILEIAGVRLPKPLYGKLDTISDGPQAGKLQAYVVSPLDEDYAAGYTYVSHFATCPNAAQHSRPRTSRAAAERSLDRGEDHA